MRDVSRFVRKKGIPGPDEVDAVGPGSGSAWLDALAGEATRVPPLRGRGSPPIALPLPSLCTDLVGFTLHAQSVVSANDRQGLLDLCRYGLRPPVAAGRVEVTPEGLVRYRMKRTFSDGTKEVVLPPTAFLRRLVALIPRPRVHMVRYHGLFAPHARGRPGRRRLSSAHPPRSGGGRDSSDVDSSDVPPDLHHPPDSTRPRRLPWAELLRRVHRVEVLTCSRCQGPVQVLAFLTDSHITAPILACLGLPSSPPPIAPARAPPHAEPSWDGADPPHSAE